MNFFRPIPILRVEAALVFAASLACYHQARGNWMAFALLFFAPDVAILPYLLGNAAGWASYNTVHSYVWPVLLAGAAGAWGSGNLLGGALIWVCLPPLGSMCGFGLKEGEDFWITHLGAIKTAARLIFTAGDVARRRVQAKKSRIRRAT